MSQCAIQLAAELAGSGEAAQAVATLLDAGSNGDADALIELAIWYLQGRVVPRNLAKTRELFKAAAELGHSDALNIYISLLANGTGGPPEWKSAMKLLRSLASTSSHAMRQVRLIDAMRIDDAGSPEPEWRTDTLCERPFIAAVRELLTMDECSYLVDMAARNFSPAMIVDPMSGQLRPDPIRTSDNAVFPWLAEDPVIHAINRRIGKVSRTNSRNGEPLQVLRYRPGQQYKPHLDAISGEANQRIFTLLVYLNDAFEGGETVFTRIGLRFRGRVGDALLFCNALDDGSPDQNAVHEGAIVLSGEKLVASRWIRQSRFGPS